MAAVSAHHPEPVMKWWRRAFGLILVLLFAPALLPFLDLAVRPHAWAAWTEVGRLLLLLRETLLLAGAVLLLALPLGSLLGFVLVRVRFPGRNFLRLLLLVPLFVPPPLLVAGWQPVLSSFTLSPLLFAGLLQALVVLPWVVLLAGLGFALVERTLEEDALTLAPPHRVVLTVTLRRTAPALAAAVLWTLLQTTSEIGIADLYQVRTFAEEVYGQLVRPIDDGSGDVELLTARAVAVALPWLLLIAALVLLTMRHIPPPRTVAAPLAFTSARPFTLTLLTALPVLTLAAVPVAGLVQRAGPLASAWGPGLRQLMEAALLAGWVGLQTATLALLACWLAREERRFRGLLLGLAVLAWTLPGPVVGLGMKQAIDLLLDATDSPVLRRLLWDGPSWLPVVWVQTIRLFPFALAVLWPAVNALPRTLLESVRVEGAGPLREFGALVVPLTLRAWGLAVVVTAGLSLGEVSASKLVSTPGATPFAAFVFMELHYGVGADLAARCLIFLAGVTLLALLAGSSPGRPALDSGGGKGDRVGRR